MNKTHTFHKILIRISGEHYLLFNYYVNTLVRMSTGVSRDFDVNRISTTHLEYEVRV
jgi:hypothetical protein